MEIWKNFFDSKKEFRKSLLLFEEKIRGKTYREIIEMYKSLLNYDEISDKDEKVLIAFLILGCIVSINYLKEGGNEGD